MSKKEKSNLIITDLLSIEGVLLQNNFFHLFHSLQFVFPFATSFTAKEYYKFKPKQKIVPISQRI
jgi:hypothetical protein